MNINQENGRWTVAMSWSEAHKAYEEGSAVERAISAVAARYEVTDHQLRSRIVRAHEDGMTVVVESDG